jgi:hypothetical protein
MSVEKEARELTKTPGQFRKVLPFFPQFAKDSPPFAGGVRGGVIGQAYPKFAVVLKAPLSGNPQ